MPASDRLTLVLDDKDHALGSATLGLVARGLDPLYAQDEDELVLLAYEQRARIGALVVPGSLALGRLDAVWGRVGHLLPGGCEAVVVVAPPRDRTLLAGLRERGMRWAVFAPYDGGELQFVVMAALSGGKAIEPRCSVRVPIRVPASVSHGGQLRFGEIRNLSVGGAFVALPNPPEPGETLSLEFPIGERPLRATAVVAHRRGAPDAGADDLGIGVTFAALAPPDASLLEGFVRERIESFRL